MKELINICKRNENGTLAIVDEKNLTVKLDEVEMTLVTTYNRKQYKVEGQYNFQYIIIA